MTDTIFLTATDDAWTSAANGVAGFLTNEGAWTLLFREAASDPGVGDTDGHSLRGSLGESVNFDLASGQQMWIRATKDKVMVAVTTS